MTDPERVGVVCQTYLESGCCDRPKTSVGTTVMKLGLGGCRGDFVVLSLSSRISLVLVFLE